eukprot:tig00021127_g18688.t1
MNQQSPRARASPARGRSPFRTPKEGAQAAADTSNVENVPLAANRSGSRPPLQRSLTFSGAMSSPRVRPTMSFVSDSAPPPKNIRACVRIRGGRVGMLGSGEGCVRPAGESSIEFTRDEAATPRGARAYDFDRVFGPGATQEEVFAAAVAPSLGEYLRGFNAAVLAYGQTGSGKTYTMQGVPGEVGAVQRSLRHIFAARAAAAAAGQEPWAVTLSMLEIYNETLLDLLAKPAAGADGAPSGPRLQIMTDATGQIRIPGLSEVAAESAEEAEAAVMAAVERRQTAATRANEVSSRSHCVLWVRTRFRVAEAVVQPSLYLVDLAGSENADQTGGEARRQQESSKINTSLLTLNKVIELLAERCRAMAAQSAALNASLTSPAAAVAAAAAAGPHIPYRTSLLTRLLQPALDGGAATCLVACVSAEPAAAPVTLRTLEYARKAAAIQLRLSRARVQPERGEAPATPQARGEAEAALEARLAELQQRAAQSEDEAGALRAALARARAALQAEREEREAEGAGLRAEAARLAADLADAREARSAGAEELRVAHAALAECRARAAKAELFGRDGDGPRGELEAARGSRSGVAGGAAAEADGLRAALAQRDADLAAARRALEEARGELGRLRGERDDDDLRIAESEARRATQAAQHAAAILQLSAELSDMRAMATGRAAGRRPLAGEGEGSSAAVGAAAAQAAAAGEAARRLERQLREARLEAAAAREELAAVRGTLQGKECLWEEERRRSSASWPSCAPPAAAAPAGLPGPRRALVVETSTSGRSLAGSSAASGAGSSEASGSSRSLGDGEAPARGRRRRSSESSGSEDGADAEGAARNRRRRLSHPIAAAGPGPAAVQAQAAGRAALAALQARRDEALGFLQARLEELQGAAGGDAATAAARRQQRRRLEAALAGLQAAYEHGLERIGRLQGPGEADAAGAAARALERRHEEILRQAGVDPAACTDFRVIVQI